jgi:predicted RNA-binding protein associated with RNAse of E/G family
MASGEWIFRDLEWDVDTLWVLEAEVSHAVWVSWLDGFEPWGWYVNLQEPFSRTTHSLQTMDLMLDVIVDRDRSWRWKDEDELQALLDWQLIDGAKAAAIRAEAESVLRRLEADKPPFNEPWHDWRPEPAWGLPELPAGWDRL